VKIGIGVLLLVGVSAIGFGYWGLNTVQGRANFDEMAGIIPLFSGVFGGLAIALAVLLIVYRLWRIRRGS
jgi:tetrahydromethanopterin S-methyltransferase subunit B